jgi:hypothetical protein
VAPEPAGILAHLDEAAAEVLAAFDEAGVDALLLKGRGLATLLYGPGEYRAFVDVDVLVAPARFRAAEDALLSLGYVDTETGRGIDDIGGVVHAHAWARIAPRPNGNPPIDLHRWLPGCRADPAVVWDALLAHRAWIELGGRQAPVLDRAGQAMHLAIHAAQHGPAVEKHVHELELALALWPADVWDSASVLADQVGATGAFAAGLRLTRRGRTVAARLGLPATNDLDWVIRHRAERPRGTFHLQALTDAQSVRDRLDVLRRSLFPQRAWIIAQHPWAEGGSLRVLAGYAAHIARAPVWAARAWGFRWRARRAGGHR